MSVFQNQQPELDLDKAKGLGVRLKLAREEKGLSANEVADSLLLSRAQIEGLEAAVVISFYGARLYAQSAEKYAAYIGLSDVVHGDLLIKPDEQQACVDSPDAQSAVVVETPIAQGTPVKRSFPVVPLILIVAAIGAAAYQLDMFSSAPPSKTQVINEAVSVQRPVATESVPAATAPVAIAPTIAVTTQQAVSASIPRGTIHMRFNGDSWVQVAEANGSKRDRVYKKGETLILETGGLQGLVIGNASEVQVESASGPVNLSPYTNKGGKVARIIGPAVRALGEQ